MGKVKQIDAPKILERDQIFITGRNLICCPRGYRTIHGQRVTCARNCEDGNLFMLVVLTAVKPLSNWHITMASIMTMALKTVIVLTNNGNYYDNSP